VAIAIARKHLPSGKGFKRDYGESRNSWGVAAAIVDNQAGYSSARAGLAYARGVEDAPKSRFGLVWFGLV
jgi:hypothetical protein